MKKGLLPGILIVSISQVAAKELLEIKINSGMRTTQSRLTTPHQIRVIDRKEIITSGASNIAEVLRGKAGLQITDLRGDGADTTISIRGFQQTANANILVLVDGRRLNYSDTRGPDIGHVSLHDIKRIEITQGSAGVIYGNQAVGGVVNIITRRFAAGQREASIETGSYGKTAARFTVSDKQTRGFSYRLAGETLETDGYRDHSARDLTNIHGSVSWRYPAGEVFFDGQHINDDQELPGALIPSEYDHDRRQRNAGFINDFSDTTVQMYRLGWRHRLSPRWKFEMDTTYRQTNTRLIQSFRDRPAPPGSKSRRKHISLNPRLIATLPGKYGMSEIVIGADLEKTDYRNYVPLQGFVINNGNDQDMQALYAQASIPLNNKLILTLGGRSARVKNKIFDNGTFGTIRAGANANDNVFVKTLGVSYKPDQQWRLYTRLDENFRFAKVDEITGAGGNILDTQKGLTFDLGAEWKKRDRYFNVGMYYLKLRDEIYYDPAALAPGGRFGTNTNLDKTIRRGIVLNGGMNLTDTLLLSADFTYTHATFAAGGLQGSTISGVSPRMATLRLDYSPTSHWNIRSELQMTSKKYAQADNLNIRKRAPGYTIMNLAATWQRKNWSATFKINNVLNKVYSELIVDGFQRGYQPSPERNLSLTATYQFD